MDTNFTHDEFIPQVIIIQFVSASVPGRGGFILRTRAQDGDTVVVVLHHGVHSAFEGASS